MKTKGLVLALVGLVGGPFLIWSGWHDYQNSTKLAAEGKTTTAQVINRTVNRRSRGPDRCFLSLQYQTEAGEVIHRQVQVVEREYDHHPPGSSASVRYLPSDPKVICVGDPVKTWRRDWVAGSILFLSGCIVGLALVGMRLKMRKAAAKIVESTAALCETTYEYALVSTAEFSHLDLAWYETSQRWLEERGFTLLANEENLTFRRTSKGVRTLLKTMAGHDGKWLAYLYHFKPPGRPGGGFKILEVQSCFSDGTFVCTSNAEAAGKLDSPAGVDALRLPAATSLDEVLNSHARRFTEAVNARPNSPPRSLASLPEVHEAQNELQRMRAAHRQQTGITREELRRMGGDRLCPAQLDELHAEAEMLREQQERRAA